VSTALYGSMAGRAVLVDYPGGKGRRLRQARPLRLCSGRRNDARAGKGGIYGSVHLKAAALPQILVGLPAPEHSSEAFARHSCEAYAALNGHHLTHITSPASPRTPWPWSATPRPPPSASPGPPAHCAPGMPVKNRGAAHDRPQPGEAPGAPPRCRPHGAERRSTWRPRGRSAASQ
jgi:hypothetical protein